MGIISCLEMNWLFYEIEILKLFLKSNMFSKVN